jgi:hypothetical protein
MIRQIRLAALAVALFSVASISNAALLSYEAFLSGPNEFPANASPGTGYTQVDYDSTAHTLRVQVTFSGLTGTTTAAHIHSPIPDPPANPLANVATQTPSFTGFPLGVTAGSMDQTFDLTLASSWRAQYITDSGGTPAAAEAAFASQVASGKAYLNIHSSTFNGGEIRGFLTPVPEPTAVALLAAGAAGLIFGRRAWRRK